MIQAQLDTDSVGGVNNKAISKACTTRQGFVLMLQYHVRMSSKFSRRLVALLALASLFILVLPASNSIAAIKQGSKCTKLGLKSGNLICSKSSGKLIWLLTSKKSDAIDSVLPRTLYVGEGSAELQIRSQSGVPVSVSSLDPRVCVVTAFTVVPVAGGKCPIFMKTDVNNKYQVVQRTEFIEIRRRNALTYTSPTEYLISSPVIILPELSSAGLLIEYSAENANQCVVRGSTVELKKIGICTIYAFQAGDSFTDPILKTPITLRAMQENQISFAPPQELSIRLKSHLLTGVASSGYSVSYRSTTPEICSISDSNLNLLKVGTCTIIASQNGDAFTRVAPEITTNINVIGQRVSEDQPDSFDGFQIKPIYVVPSDGEDRKYDINGYIADALTEGNAALKLGIGQEFQIDSIGSDYDIQFFRSSYSRDYLSKSSSAGDELMKEMKIADKFGLNRKDYVFFIDVDGFKYDTACGYAGIPGRISVVAVGPSKSGSLTCVGPSLQLKNYVAHTWVHEVFHNLGVEHTTNDPCDMMRGASTNYCSTSWTIDKDRNRYVGSDKQGVNVLSLRVWKGYVADQNLRASCDLFYSTVSRSDGLRYALCPTGTQVIGALTYCWSSIRSIELQVWKNNAWTSLGEGSHYNEPWGKSVSWKCNNSNYTAPWKQITVTTPGIQKYRWMVNGTESEQFNIIWQN